jgi:hypothetical protein
MKSAQYAGFVDSATGRFVKPGIAQKDDGDRPQEKPTELGSLVEVMSRPVSIRSLPAC